jgi:hypothetical protein
MNKKEVLDAIKGSGAIMSTVARHLSVDWHTAKKYCNKWEETRRALENETEHTIDLAEITVLKGIETGDIQAAKWYLSTKGKKRGYSERHEITGAEGEPIEVKWQK